MEKQRSNMHGQQIKTENCPNGCQLNFDFGLNWSFINQKN
jgi:hypothetical protein